MRSLQTHAWSMLCAALGLLCLIVWLLPVDLQIALRWRSDLWLAQPWTLWSASLTHLSDTHLGVNLLALLCLAIIGQHVGTNHLDALALLIAWPLVHLALLLWPQIQSYAGFSGLNYAIAGIFIARSAMNFIVHRQVSAIAFLFASLLLAKLIWEAPWAQPLRMDASWGFTVVQAAHFTGFVSGLLVAACIHAVQMRKQSMH